MAWPPDRASLPHNGAHHYPGTKAGQAGKARQRPSDRQWLASQVMEAARLAVAALEAEDSLPEIMLGVRCDSGLWYIVRAGISRPEDASGDSP